MVCAVLSRICEGCSTFLATSLSSLNAFSFCVGVEWFCKYRRLSICICTVFDSFCGLTMEGQATVGECRWGDRNDANILVLVG
jgi:hypothetical protein